MAGAFQTSRDIFENPIWQNIVEFRLFFLIYGKATFADGVRIGDITLERGQWIRSVRNLQTDLEYIENRAIKKYSLSTIHRAVDNLVKQNRISVKQCELGTLFTVINYAKYQGLENYKSDIENAERTQRERQENGDRTEREQRQNNNKNANNANKEKKYIYSSSHMTMAEKLKSLILQNNPGARTPTDLSKWATVLEQMERLDKRSPEQINAVMEFSQKDPFWKSNILSASKLREQFDKLWLQRDRGKQPPQNQPKTSSNPFKERLKGRTNET